MYSTAYNLWTFTWFVHFELPFRQKGTEKIHTERFFLLLSIYSILYGYIPLFLKSPYCRSLQYSTHWKLIPLSLQLNFKLFDLSNYKLCYIKSYFKISKVFTIRLQRDLKNSNPSWFLFIIYPHNLSYPCLLLMCMHARTDFF